MIARLVLLVVALVALGWLGIMERDQRLVSRAKAAASHMTGPESEAAVLADFRAARLLNPDAQVDLSRAFIYLARDQGAPALALAQDVARREPDNLLAWSAVLRLAHGRDAALEHQARAHLAALDPIDARGR